MSAEEFRDDEKDAGEMGAGHCVTALYEVVWAEDSAEDAGQLKYQALVPREGEAQKEWGTLRIRYKKPGKAAAAELERAFGQEVYHESLTEARMLLAASAAEFAMILRGSENRGESSCEHLLSLWEGVDYEDSQEAAELLELVKLARK